MTKGIIYGVGLGPGSPDLITLKAAQILEKTKIIAYFKKKNRDSIAKRIAKKILNPDIQYIVFNFPLTTEISFLSNDYKKSLSNFYDQCCEKIAHFINDGEDVAVLCEGDPFFYGSFMHLYRRLCINYSVEIIPGITGMSAAWTSSKIPIAWGDDSLTIIMGTTKEKKILNYLLYSDAVVFMKIGRHLKKIVRILKKVKLIQFAVVVEYASMPNERVLPLLDIKSDALPYFSIIIIHGKGRRP